MRNEVRGEMQKYFSTTCKWGSVYPSTLLLATWMEPSLWKVILEQWVRVSARSGPCASHRQSRAQSMAWLLLLRKWRLLVRRYATGSCTTKKKNARCVFSGKCFNRQLWRALSQCCVDFIHPGRARRHWYCLCQQWGNVIEKKTVILNRAPVKPLHLFFFFQKVINHISKKENLGQVLSFGMSKTSFTGFWDKKGVDECEWEEKRVLVQVTGKQAGILH